MVQAQEWLEKRYFNKDKISGELVIKNFPNLKRKNFGKAENSKGDKKTIIWVNWREEVRILKTQIKE